jgi:hypothetical protein
MFAGVKATLGMPTWPVAEPPTPPPTLAGFPAPKLKLFTSIVDVWEEGGLAMLDVTRPGSTESGFTDPSFLAACIFWDFLLRLDFLAGMAFLLS